MIATQRGLVRGEFGQTLVDQPSSDADDAIGQNGFDLGAISEELAFGIVVDKLIAQEAQQGFTFKLGVAGLARRPTLGPTSIQAVPDPSGILLFGLPSFPLWLDGGRTFNQWFRWNTSCGERRKKGREPRIFHN